MSNSFVTPWTVALQASLSVGFLRKEYWNGLPFPSQEGPPDPGIELKSSTLASRFFNCRATKEAPQIFTEPYCVPAVCKLLVMLRDLCLYLPGCCLLVVEIDHSK